jgi:3-dehydroquinate synthase
LIRDVGFFNWLEQNGKNVCDLDEDALAHAIEISCQAKAGIVEADEHETGRRALLNLGHTFGHALETSARYDGRLLHGEAVAIGIVMAFELSLRMGLCEREHLDRVEAHYASVGLPSRASYIQPSLKTTAAQLYEIMKRDKKARDGKIRYILVNGIGEAFVSGDAPERMVKDVLQDTLGGEDQEKEGLWTRVFSSHS